MSQKFNCATHFKFVNIPSSLARWYDVIMLRITSNSDGAYPRICIDGAPAKAWIEHKPWQYGSTDWTLWYEHRGQLARGKCQLRLEIESRLRAWLLRRYRLRLGTLSFDELRRVAAGEGNRVVKEHPRWRGYELV
jgi:hypothetical protein